MTGTKGKILWVILLTGLLTVTCDKEENIIPYVPVSFSVNLNVVNDLNVPGNSVYFAGPGFGGVIIYCELPGSYYAYDAACTHEISSACKVRNDGVLGTCACCGSQYILMGGGYPSKGPATFPLQSYHVSVMSNILRIYN